MDSALPKLAGVSLSKEFKRVSHAFIGASFGWMVATSADAFPSIFFLMAFFVYSLILAVFASIFRHLKKTGLAMLIVLFMAVPFGVVAGIVIMNDAEYKTNVLSSNVDLTPVLGFVFFSFLLYLITVTFLEPANIKLDQNSTDNTSPNMAENNDVKST